MSRRNRNDAPAAGSSALTAEAAAAGAQEGDTQTGLADDNAAGEALTTEAAAAGAQEGESQAALPDDADAQNSQAPDTGHADSQGLDATGASDAAPGGGSPTGAVVDEHERAQAPEGGWCYQVIEPFKFKGSVIKPGVWIQLTDDEAEIYGDAGVIGNDQAWPPQDA